MIYSNKKKPVYFLVFIFSFCAVQPAASQMAHKVQVFQQLNILFNPATFPDGVNESDAIIRLANGRIALKKINISAFKRNTAATAKITLTSNGDPWDKSGSCFIIPSHSAINMI